MNFCKRLGQYQILFGVFALCLFVACGGGSSSSTTSSTTTTSGITATITQPSASSSSISALVKPGVAFLTEAPVSSAVVTMYDTTGTLIGTATTDSAGTCTVELASDVVVEEGDTVIVESDAGIAGLATIDANLSAGTIDFEATLALEELKTKLGDNFTGSWEGLNFDELDLDFHPKCAFLMAKKKWEGAEADSSGLAGQISYMKNIMAGAVIGEDLGSYGNIGDMAQAFINDTVDTTFASTAATNAATYIGGNAESYVSAYTTAIAANNAVTDAFTLYYAGGAGVGATSASVNAAVSAPAEDSFCDEILEDETLGANAVLTMLEGSTDATTFVSNYAGDTKATGLITTFQQWKGDGGYVFDENFNPAAMGGLWESAVTGGYEIDPDQIYNLMGEFQPVDGVDPHSWGGIVGMTYFADPTADPTQVANWGGAQVLGGWQFDVYDDSIIGADYTTSFTGAIATGQDFGSCLTNPDGCSTLFEDDDFQISGMTYATPTYNSTAVCGNYTCEAGESGTTCSADCFTQTQAYTSGFTYSGNPDDFTMIMEDAPTAPTGPTPTGPTPTGPMTMP